MTWIFNTRISKSSSEWSWTVELYSILYLLLIVFRLIVFLCVIMVCFLCFESQMKEVYKFDWLIILRVSCNWHRLRFSWLAIRLEGLDVWCLFCSWEAVVFFKINWFHDLSSEVKLKFLHSPTIHCGERKRMVKTINCLWDYWSILQQVWGCYWCGCWKLLFLIK